MRYQGTLLAVRDLARSKQFYCDLFDMTVTEDFGANITLSNCFSLQTLDTWTDFLHKTEGDLTFQHNTSELYFETSDFDGFLSKLANQPAIELVHPPQEHVWGQRVVRCYDPDHHIIEIGEDMGQVVQRFLKSGLSMEETAQRMNVPLAYVQAMTAS